MSDTKRKIRFRPSRIVGPKENASELEYSRFYRKPALEIPPLVAEVSLSFMASFSTPVHKEN